MRFRLIGKSLGNTKKWLNNYTQEVGTSGLANTAFIIAYVATSAACVRTCRPKK